MSRCRACNTIMTAHELKTKELKRRKVYEDLCLQCRCIVYEIDVSARDEDVELSEEVKGE